VQDGPLFGEPVKVIEIEKQLRTHTLHENNVDATVVTVRLLQGSCVMLPENGARSATGDEAIRITLTERCMMITRRIMSADRQPFSNGHDETVCASPIWEHLEGAHWYGDK